ncbi:MAG TPA: hypothetical protein PKH16_13970 [Aequorivita sp.]|nr:hypothetical protein [Aequorivita sp.]
MKNLFYLIMIVFFLYGCNTDDNSGGSDDNGGGGSGSALLVKKIKTNYSDGSGSSEEIFHYVNNQLIAIEYDCYDIVRYFVYGTSNKVSNSYRFFDGDFDINTFNLNDVINDSETIHTEYIYTNDKLNTIERDGIVYITFEYNSTGKLRNMVVNDYHIDTYTITYENDKISSIFVSDETGDSYVLTFNIDDKINPFHELFRQFGIIGSDGCNSYYNYMFIGGFPLLENNIVTRFVDNNPREPATYVYMENGTPEAISYDGSNGNRYTHYFSY